MKEHEHRRPLPGRHSPALARGYRKEDGSRHRRDGLGAGRRRPGAQRHPRPRALGRELLHGEARRPRARRPDVRGRTTSIPASPRSTPPGSTSASRAGSTWVTHGGSWVGYRSNITRVPSRALLGDRAVQPRRTRTRGACDVGRGDLPQGQARPAGSLRRRSQWPKPVVAEWQPRDLSRATPAPISAQKPTRAA